MDVKEDRQSALDDFAKLSMSSDTVPALATAAGPPQIVGAQKVAVYRDSQKVLTNLRVLAQAAGESWYYRFPVRNKKENRIDYIEGPSIKLANDLARTYGNCETDVRVIDAGDSWIFYARFIDLETGYSLVRPFQQRKSGGKIGGDDDARRVDIAFQIGASKAIRNVTVNALQTYSDFAFDEARNSLVERIGKNLAKYRERTVERLGALVELVRVERVMGRTAEQWLAPDIAKVIAMMKAVDDGMASMDETFPPLDSGGDAAHVSSAPLDAFAEGSGDAAPGQAAGTGHPGGQQSSANAAADDSGGKSGDVAAPIADPPPAGAKLSVASAALAKEMTEKILNTANDDSLSAGQKLAALDDSRTDWEAALPGSPQLVGDAFRMAAMVAEGKVKPDKARKYLDDLRSKSND